MYAVEHMHTQKTKADAVHGEELRANCGVGGTSTSQNELVRARRKKRP